MNGKLLMSVNHLGTLKHLRTVFIYRTSSSNACLKEDGNQMSSDHQVAVKNDSITGMYYIRILILLLV